MKRRFLVTGNRPAHSKQHNDLLKAFDLGIEGAFVPFVDEIAATLRNDVTPDQIERQIPAIKSAYEHVGCVGVIVTELHSKE